MPKKKQCPKTETHQSHTWAEQKRGLFQCYGFINAEDTAYRLLIESEDGDGIEGLLDTLTEEIEKRVRRTIATNMRQLAARHSGGEVYAEDVLDSAADSIESGEL